MPLSKVLITTGFGTSALDSSEVIDLKNPGNNCSNLADYPESIYSATGGLVDDQFPLICGGTPHFHSDTCFVVGNENISVKMSDTRVGAASVIINRKKLWVTGGSYSTGGLYPESLSSTIYVELDGNNGTSYPGPELPMPLTGHSLLVIDDTTCILTGGGRQTNIVPNKISKATFFHNLDTPQLWTFGPDLPEERVMHASAIMEKMGKKYGGLQ